MASVLKVDKLDPQSGTALEIGTSGDTVSIPSGATLDISASTLTPPATMPASSGVNLTALNATQLTSGTVPAARLSGVGKIGQVLQTVGSYVTTIASTTYALNMSAPSITPSATTSKILIIHSAPSGLTLDNTSNMGHVALYRDATNITTFGHGSSYASYQGASPLSGTSLIYLDSPSSTSAIVYSVYVKTDNASLSMIYGYSSGQPRGSSITVMEILA
jgi:hypothetical protein